MTKAWVVDWQSLSGNAHRREQCNNRTGSGKTLAAPCRAAVAEASMSLVFSREAVGLPTSSDRTVRSVEAQKGPPAQGIL